jgi:hypothetical protein
MYDAGMLEHAYRVMSNLMDAERTLTVVERMSNERLEKQRDIAKHVWDAAADSAQQPHIPLQYGMFFLVFGANHLSVHARLGRRLFWRFARDHGFESLEAACVAIRDGWQPDGKTVVRYRGGVPDGVPAEL